MTTAADRPFSRRRAGLLLHLTSLPGGAGHGIIGHDAYRLIEWMAQAGLGVWQTLPLAPTHHDGSPYHALSAHAMDPAFISLDWLLDRTLLDDFDRKLPHHQALARAFAAYCLQPAHPLTAAFDGFKHRHRHWLDDYALFMAIRTHHHDRPWQQWQPGLRDRQPAAIKAFSGERAEAIEQHRFLQFVVYTQWLELKDYAHRHDVLLFGDIPIYVALDSVDVWAHRELYLLDADGRPTAVAGVPPDYFSATGQRWGNPLYRWEVMKKRKFQWWSDRIASQLELFDLIRIDHFRGLEAYWEIPADCDTAIDGKWVEAPGAALLQQLEKTLGKLPLVAEDLGIITAEVTQLRLQFGLPGMVVLQFAFDGNPDNGYLPHNHPPLSVVYTGTHDNDTSESWFADLSAGTRRYVDDYLGPGRPGECIAWRLLRCAMASTSCLAMLPMQDLLAPGKGQRMNTPGTTQGNWQWRFEWSQLPDHLAPSLRHLAGLYGRLAATR